ncbi:MULTISPECIES: hypothetical protein [unclassified Nocardiopsis]|uniref:hypothetical protein n=1 Tax=Nocardiopsis TaxID=2013 RepID=UPI00387AA9CB
MGTATLQHETDRTLRGRMTLLAVVLIAVSLTVAANLLMRPLSPLDFEEFTSFQQMRDAVWLFGLIGSLGSVLAYTAFALAVCVLAPGKGSLFATVGTVITGLGALCFGMGFFAVTNVGWYATGPRTGVSGEAVFAYFMESPERVLAVQISGFLAAAVGVVLLCIALLRARSVPAAVAGAPAVLLIVSFLVDPQFINDIITALFMVSLAVVGGFLLRTARSRA